MELSKISSLLFGNNFKSDSISVVYNPGNFNKPVISALATPDSLFSLKRNPSPIAGPIGNFNIFSNDVQLLQKQNQSVNSAIKEWQSGVKENLGKNSGTRVNQYYKNSGFDPGGDGGWCGFFVAFNYAQAGFKSSPHLAGQEKGRDFFMYRQYTDHSKVKNAKLDLLKQEHQLQGSQRQYFMLEESPNLKYIKNNKKTYSNFNAAANTFNFRNLPIRPGDTVLFNTGDSGGHLGMVVAYDNLKGKLVTIEGNAGGMGADGKKKSANAVVKKEYDLTNPSVRARIDGFGRPALGDFNSHP